MKYIFTLLCVLFFLVFIPDNIISQVKYEKHLLQFCAGKFENYVKFDMGNELARELHPRLWRIIANISECEVHFCYNKDESEPIILKIQGKIKIDYPSLTYEAPNGPVALSRYPAKMDEVLPSSKMSFSFQINYYLRTRFGRTKSNWSILNLQDGVVQKFGGSHHFGEVWKKSRKDLIERGFQNPSRKKIYNNLQASFEIESFSNPHINPRRSISRFVENKQKRGKEGENTQENSFKEGNDESVDSTEELNDTTRTNQQTTSSSSLTNEQRKQQQQQKIAEIKEMERKAQGGQKRITKNNQLENFMKSIRRKTTIVLKSNKSKKKSKNRNEKKNRKSKKSFVGHKR